MKSLHALGLGFLALSSTIAALGSACGGVVDVTHPYDGESGLPPAPTLTSPPPVAPTVTSTTPPPDHREPPEGGPCNPEYPDNPYACPPPPACAGVGPGENQVDLGNHDCNNCLRTNCCAVVEACFGNGRPPGDGGVATEPDCVAYDGCWYSCQSDPNPTTCLAACDADASPNIIAIHKAVADCANGTCGHYPPEYMDGGVLCEF